MLFISYIYFKSKIELTVKGKMMIIWKPTAREHVTFFRYCLSKWVVINALARLRMQDSSTYGLPEKLSAVKSS